MNLLPTFILTFVSKEWKGWIKIGKGMKRQADRVKEIETSHGFCLSASLLLPLLLLFYQHFLVSG